MEKKREKRDEGESDSKNMPLLWLGPDTVAPPPTLFSQDGFCCLVLSTYLSRNECPWGSSLALGPSPTEPPMHSYLKPLDGQPLSPPHLVVQSLKRKKAKKKKKKKALPYFQV